MGCTTSDRTSVNSAKRKPECPPQRKWFAIPEDEVYDILGTDPSGISESQVEILRGIHGFNEMAMRRKNSVLRAIFKQVHQLLIYILLLAAVVTALLGQTVDTVVILAVVLATVAVGFMQERKADKAVEAIDKLVVSECAVVRGGTRKVIPSRELVPGDIVLLESGNKVPADMRLIYSKGLQVDESILTGESVPAEKTSDVLREDIGAVADMVNMAFAGTLVTYGRGRGVIVGTGDRTEISKISACMRSAEEIETPLQKRTSSFAIYISGVVAILAILTFVGGLLVGQGAVSMFLASVSVAVSIIPEGLPALVTVALALGVKAMAGRNAIVRNLPSVETLGSTTVICSDKTGTLTMNQMTVIRVFSGGMSYEVSGNGYSTKGEFTSQGAMVQCNDEPALGRILLAGSVCNDSSLKDENSIMGDPTEAALMVSAAKAGISEHPHRLDEIPFESDIQFMATLNETQTGHKIFLKGVPEKIIRLCNSALARDGSVADIDREAVMSQANDMAAGALRVIAIAEKTVGPDVKSIDAGDIQDFIFLGLQGMIDPPRPEAVESIRRCQEASIRVVMITGDHAVTAGAIAAKLDIAREGSRIVTGDALEAMSDDELYAIVEDVSVYARASPIHKYRIVMQLRRHGEIIAVTGDGVNDAPALRAADIGVAMGMSGTDVAKEASDMILADDNFASIVNAVEEGRHMYNNLQKMLTFILPTNFGQCLVIVAAIFAGSVIPMLPLHVLWVNLVTSVSCSLPLAVEGKEEGLLRRPPRDPDSPLFTRQMLGRLIMVSTIMTLGAFLAFYYSIAMGVSEGEARTITMTAVVMMQLAYLFTSRSFTKPAVGKDFFSNRWIFIGSGLTVLLQLFAVYVPFMNTILRTEPIHAFSWVVVLGTAFALFAVIELEKVVVRHLNARREGKHASARVTGPEDGAR